MAQQGQAHVCCTEPQGKANERKEDTKEKPSHSLPAYFVRTAMTGQISKGRALQIKGYWMFFGVEVMASLDRFKSEQYDALRRKRKETNRHFITVG